MAIVATMSDMEYEHTEDIDTRVAKKRRRIKKREIDDSGSEEEVNAIYT